MEFNNAASLGKMLEQMSTEELRDLLDQELHTEPVNADAIRLIRGILQVRNQNCDVEITPEMARAWDKYQKDTDAIWKKSQKERRIRNWLIRGTAAAAVLAVMLLPVVPQKAGAESLWQTLSRWTEQLVEYFSPTDNEGRILTYEYESDHPGLQQIYDIVTEMGITVPVVPMWLPEGYELVEHEVTEYPAKTQIYSRFKSKENTLVCNIEKYNLEVSRQYQKDEITGSIFEYGGIKHQLMRNNGKIVVLWHRDNIEISMSADCHEDDMRKVLKSVYSMEE